MLVSFHKGFTMEGEASFTEKKHFWSKSSTIRKKIYRHTGISGICDETELEAVVDRLTKAELESAGWGKDFSGWQRVAPYEECLKIADKLNWHYRNRLPKNRLSIEFLDNWTVEEAVKKLNGKQFAQYCRDYGIPCYNE